MAAPASEQPSVVAPRARKPRLGPFPISVTLAVSIGVLVAIAVVSVLAIQWSTSRRNTLDLVNVITALVVEGIEDEIDGHLRPAARQARFISRLIADGTYELSDKEALTDLLRGALSGMPQIAAIVVYNMEQQAVGVRRRPRGGTEAFERDRRGDPEVRQATEEMKAAKEAFWGKLFVSPGGFTIINLRQPLRRDGRLIGFMVVAITIRNLSKIVAEAGESFAGTAFVLYGSDHVLAHPLLASGDVQMAETQPVFPLASFGDVVLASLWQGKPTRFLSQSEDQEVIGVQYDVAGEEYLALYKWTRTYGATPWAIGVWYRFDNIDTELRRLAFSGLAGVAVLVFAILAAILLGRFLARPIQEAATGAARVGELELERVERLPSSVIRELDDQSRAFNTMLASLRSFETYVPRSLVQRLIHLGEEQAVGSEERELTLMFTDIVGFTPMSERLPAGQVADFLNQHFAHLGRCIEAEAGTIDKFIGDAIMAFWGAPEEQSDTALRACRAALAMAEALAADNEKRQAAGLAPVRMRIGIHTGPVVVGNIGSPGRINYTVVGDTVNAAQRLESLGKELDRGDAATILVSEATAAALGPGFTLEHAGAFAVKGRTRELDVYRLVP